MSLRQSLIQHGARSCRFLRESRRQLARSRGPSRSPSTQFRSTGSREREFPTHNQCQSLLVPQSIHIQPLSPSKSPFSKINELTFVSADANSASHTNSDQQLTS